MPVMARPIRIIAIFIALLIFANVGCTKRPSHVGQAADGSTSGNGSTNITRADSIRRVPPRVDGEPVGASDSLIHAAAPKLEPWANMWRRAMPAFEPDSLIRVGVAPAFRGYVQPLKGIYPPDEEKRSTFKILSARSPGGRYNLIFDWYLVIEEDAGEIDISGEPDSAPLLLDLRRATSSQFESGGAMRRYDWGVWLSPTKFALAGTQEADASSRWVQARINIYSIGDSTVTEYTTRPVPTGNYAKYRSAWEEWVGSRFRALEKTRQGS
jgi:hypothetical protein